MAWSDLVPVLWCSWELLSFSPALPQLHCCITRALMGLLNPSATSCLRAALRPGVIRLVVWAALWRMHMGRGPGSGLGPFGQETLEPWALQVWSKGDVQPLGRPATWVPQTACLVEEGG